MYKDDLVAANERIRILEKQLTETKTPKSPPKKTYIKKFLKYWNGTVLLILGLILSANFIGLGIMGILRHPLLIVNAIAINSFLLVFGAIRSDIDYDNRHGLRNLYNKKWSDD